MRARFFLVASWLSLGSAAAQGVLFDFRGDNGGDNYGMAVVGLGDLDGDGRADFAVGIPRLESPLVDAGRVRGYSGATGAWLFDLSGETAGDQFGFSLAVLGDVDQDGVGDLAIGMRFRGTGPTFRPGGVRVVSGATRATLYEVLGVQHEEEFGLRLVTLGDVNGDGLSDFAVSAIRYVDPNLGRTGRVAVLSGANGATLYTLMGTAANEFFGIDIAGAGDVDGDGVPDLVLGASGNSVAGDRTGMVRVVRGQNGATLFTFHGEQLVMGLGTGVGGAGDVDRDGHADVLGGAVYFSEPASTECGLVRLYSGATGAVLREWHGLGPQERMGAAMLGGEDLTGDGIPDIVVGGSGVGGVSGRVRIFSGADGVQFFARAGSLSTNGLGTRVALLGDLDGLGASEVAGCAPTAYGPGSQANTGQVLVWSLCTPPARYCTATTGRAGCTPAIGPVGYPSLTGPDTFAVRATSVPNQTVGLLVWSRKPDALPFGGGTLCVQQPAYRTHVVSSNGSPAGVHDCSGVLTYPLTHAFAQLHAFGAGEHVYAQFLVRDPGAGSTAGWSLSEGLDVTWCL